MGGIYVETILSVNNPQAIPPPVFLWPRVPTLDAKFIIESSNSGMVDEKPKNKHPVEAYNQFLPKKSMHALSECRCICSGYFGGIDSIIASIGYQFEVDVIAMYSFISDNNKILHPIILVWETPFQGSMYDV